MASGNGARAVETERPGPAWLGLRLKTKTPFIVAGTCAVIILAVRVAWASWGPQLIINYTRSEPYGIYRVEPLPASEYRRDMMVIFPVPESSRALVVERGWINAGHPLMKQVGAVPGDRVCIDDARIEVNGAVYGPIYETDSLGRPMPRVRGCFSIAPGQYLPLSNFTEKSFDGRYVGPQPLAEIIGRVEPVWLF